MILVIGGTGNVGGALVGELLKRRANVRVLARKPSEEGNLPAGVEVAIGDLLDPVSLQKALLGVDKLYLLNAVTPDELTQGLIAYNLAKRLKLKSSITRFSAWSTSRMSHTLPRSSRLRTPCGSLMSRSQLFVQTTFFKTTQR